MKEKREYFIEAWKKIFDVDEVQDDDNFFELGGDSMKGVQLLGYLAEKGLKLDMLKIYTRPTVGEMIEELEEMDPVEIPEAVFEGSAGSEEMEKLLKDPSIRKAMAEFGISAEDIPMPSDSAVASDTVRQAEQQAPKAGPETPYGMPVYPGAGQPQPGVQAGSGYMPVQPGCIPVPGGYMVPVQLMMFVPALPSGNPEGQPPMMMPYMPYMPYPAFNSGSFWPWNASENKEGMADSSGQKNGNN